MIRVPASVRRLAALAAMLLPAAAMAQAPSPIEGVWELPVPQTELKPADGQPVPFTPEGRKRYQAHRAAAAKGQFGFDAMKTSCSSPGQPRLMLTPKPFAVFVRPRMVTLLYQWNRLYRQIAVGPAFANPTLGENWWSFGLKQGHATGQWEGDTLVVQTDSFLEDGLLDDFLPTGEKLKLTERLRLRAPGVLEDSVTIDDPQYYARPWTTVLTYQRSAQKLPFPEDVCLERLRAQQKAR
ncbi:hypothetical protein WSK_1902 [Novosphingobium sp. Rr 2-17]|uniref:hypothetical protein n=1 Tax=Novosphingobium sp. Rr 2-17 TaxID=555793 RepID=UPI0002697EA0|nr:hypothetical protein [Novosphingobium sp. Rr 2-17]EIZ79566.1 hypothetical protein WSK_1902 [Novosphingobium sp. Rr 2-17]